MADAQLMHPPTVKPHALHDDPAEIVSSRDTYLNALKDQLEYYFSVGNLSKDTFLCSVMSSTRVVDQSEWRKGRHCPLVIIARFANVNKIVRDFLDKSDSSETIECLLREAAELSTSLEVVRLYGTIGEAIGPRDGCKLPYEDEGLDSGFALENDIPDKPVRNTIMLRDMSPSATESEVRSIFSWDDCIPVKDVHSDVGNCWFVTFNGSEDKVVDIVLKLSKMTFKDEPIKVRLKPESTVKKYSVYKSASDLSQEAMNEGYYNLDQSPPQSPPRTFSTFKPTKFNKNSSKIRNGKERKKHLSSMKSRKQPEERRVTLPPPPLLDSHFPALSGDATKLESNENLDSANKDKLIHTPWNEHRKNITIDIESKESANVIKTTKTELPDVNNENSGKCHVEVETIKEKENIVNVECNNEKENILEAETCDQKEKEPVKSDAKVATVPQPFERKTTVGGYAAALLKHPPPKIISTPPRKSLSGIRSSPRKITSSPQRKAPSGVRNVPIIVTASPKLTSKTRYPSSQNKKKLNKQKPDVMHIKSLPPVPALDDSSLSKSSTSSKSESTDKQHSSWCSSGMSKKKSFADVLKAKQHAENAELK